MSCVFVFYHLVASHCISSDETSISRFTGPSCMSTNTIIVTCNAVLSLLVTSLTILPCTKKTTGGLVPALLQAAIGEI